jgi:hypothetical protein
LVTVRRWRTPDRPSDDYFEPFAILEHPQLRGAYSISGA